MLGKHTLLLGLFALFPLGVAAQSADTGAAKTASPAASAGLAAPTAEERVFDITRDGNKIGTQVVDITRDGDKTTVKFKTHIEVEIMFVVVHRFDHVATEIWNGGKFVSYKAFTKENSDVNKLTAAPAEGDKIALTVNGEEKNIDGNLVFASFWNRDFLGQKTLLHPDTGRELSVEVADLGEDTIALKDGSSVKAHHYKISGDIERDLWFDGDNLVRIKLFGSDHSLIVSELTSAKSN